MGFRQVRTSDLSGAEIPDDQIVTVLIKAHPDLTEGKVFDASVDELAGLKTVANLVEIELRSPSGITTQVVCTKAEFSKVVPDGMISGFDSSRGRRSGFRPNGTNGG